MNVDINTVLNVLFKQSGSDWMNRKSLLPTRQLLVRAVQDVAHSENQFAR